MCCAKLARAGEVKSAKRRKSRAEFTASAYSTKQCCSALCPPCNSRGSPEDPVVSPEDPVVAREDPVVAREDLSVSREDPIISREAPEAQRGSSLASSSSKEVTGSSGGVTSSAGATVGLLEASVWVPFGLVGGGGWRIQCRSNMRTRTTWTEIRAFI